MVDGSNNDSRKFWQKPDTLWPVFLLLLIAYALYFQTFGHGWTLDDSPVILENTDIRSLKGLLEDTYKGRPLREMTFWIDYSLFGLDAGPWHVQQIFWHGLNGVLLWLLVRRLGGGAVTAWAASLLFIVHPIQAEVVANISNRKDSLALAFSLLSMLTYIRAVHGRKRWRWAILSGALYLTACLGKQNALLLPLGFAAYEYVFLARERRFLLAKPKWVGAAAVFGLVAVVLRFFHLDGIARHRAKIEPFLVEMNLTPPFRETDYFQMVLKAWSFMWRRIVWPSDLAPEYVFSAPDSWFDPWIVASVLGAILGLLALFWSRKRSPIVFFAMVWFLIFFLPIANIWPHGYFAADRYYYAPLSALSILAAVAIQAGFRRKKEWTTIGALALMFALAFATFRQAGIWETPATLWSHAVQVNPRSAPALNYMGQVASSRGDFREAITWYVKAAKVNPSRPMARHNLGWSYERLGDRRMAIYYFRQFLARVPYSGNPVHHRAAVKVREHLAAEYGVKY